MASLSVWHVLALLAIVVLVFGTKKLRTLGSDLGVTIKEFRQATSESKEGDMQGVYQQVSQSEQAAARTRTSTETH
ncbi:MAG: Sec-independent protein translocase subunit TatA [Dyella sp.]